MTRFYTIAFFRKLKSKSSGTNKFLLFPNDFPMNNLNTR